jgi:hypothetical protein
MSSSAGFGEERIERVLSDADALVRRHLSVGLNAMFETVQFPARVADLASGLVSGLASIWAPAFRSLVAALATLGAPFCLALSAVATIPDPSFVWFWIGSYKVLS